MIDLAKEQAYAMLNGELGRLDGGTLDHAILELHEAAGFEGEL